MKRKNKNNSKTEQQLNDMYEDFLRQREEYKVIHTESEKRFDIVVVS